MISKGPPSANSPSVVMVIQTFYPTIGGAEIQCLTLSRALKERGSHVIVLTERLRNTVLREEIHGIHVRRVGWGGPRLWNSISFMIMVAGYLFLLSSLYQTIHVHLAASHAVAAAFIGKLLGKRVVVKIGGGNEVGEIALSRNKFWGRLKLRALGWLRPSFVIVNDDQRRELHGFGLEKVPVFLIPNGVNTEVYFPPSLAGKNATRERLGWKGLVFLFVGRYSPDKLRLDVFENLIQAWARVSKTQGDMLLRFVGKGPLEGDYQRIIEAYGVQSSVQLMPATDKVLELYQGADVFLLPSIMEGLSNAMLEAMATGLPIMASRVPGITDMVKEDVHGTLFDPLSIEEIETCLKKIVQNKNELQRMGKNSEAMADKYSINKAIESYLSLYTKA